MSIVFFKDENMFHLSNNKFSMFVQIHESGMVLCPYFGKHLSELDAEAINSASPDWYNTYFSTKQGGENLYDNLWLNSSSFLVPTSRGMDSRPSAICVEGFEDNKLDFRYESYRIYSGKPSFEIMPYIRDGGDAQTLELVLRDKYKNLVLVLSLTVFEKYNCIVRNTKLINNTDNNLWLTNAMSYVQDFARADLDVIHFPGEWAFERQFRREHLVEGRKVISTSSGRSSHEHNPFVIISEPQTDENHGDAYAFSMMYSGSFKCEASVSKTGVTRVVMGLNNEDFRYEIKAGEEFSLPEGICVFSSLGFGELSRQLHDIIRENVVKDGNLNAYRSILLNSWEGCYFDFDTEKVIKLIEEASTVGTELFVLDDGWFGKRNNESTSLGDWYVNTDKVDLKRIADACHANSMMFGLWIEPEMVNLFSDLIDKHPEYAAVDFNTDFGLSRHQVPLNFANDEVVDYIYEHIAKVLEEYEIDYVKWDHNRSLEDCYAQNLDANHQGEFTYRNTLGYYKLAKRLTNRFPTIHFQGCASGGGRFDLGTLFYFPEIWTSDENDPVQRLFIQYGTSFAYPPAVMGSHVNDSKSTCFRTKAEIALFGSYGFELNPVCMSQSDKDEVIKVNDIYHKYHTDVILNGDLYRLISPFDGKAFAIDMVGKDKSKCLFLYVNLLKQMRTRRFVKLQGLKADSYYKNSLDGKIHKGEFYENVGINLSWEMKAFDSYLVVLEETKHEIE